MYNAETFNNWPSLLEITKYSRQAFACWKYLISTLLKLLVSKFFYHISCLLIQKISMLPTGMKSLFTIFFSCKACNQLTVILVEVGKENMTWAEENHAYTKSSSNAIKLFLL
jgi:hypothetical protein